MAGENNKKESVEFLAANKTKEGVVTLPSGLQYKILTEGTGPKPRPLTPSLQLSRHALSGAEFDSSYKRGQPASFPVNGVIKGWTKLSSSCRWDRVATLCSIGAGLWRPRSGRGHRPRRDSHL